MQQVIGGAERVLHEQAVGLAARGHAVRVLARATKEQAGDRLLMRGVEEVSYLVDRRHPIVFCFSSVRNARRAAVALHRESPVDVIVAHQALPALGLLFIPLSSDSAPRWPHLVAVAHSLAHEEFETRTSPQGGVMGQVSYRWQSLARKWIERRVLKRASRVLVLSDFMRGRVQQCHGIRTEVIRVIAGGVDTEVFSPGSDRQAVRTALGLEKDAFVLLTVRNLVPRMGLDALIQAAAALRKEIPRVQLLIGGSGPLRSALERQIKALGLEGCVRLLGFVPEAALPDYYRAADLFVLPTVQLEGFGLVTVEALASGTPVFGTRIGATEEILGKLDPSLLSSGPDAESLAVGIAGFYRRFTSDPGARARIAEAGRALVLRDFTWSRHCEQLETVLAEAANV